MDGSVTLSLQRSAINAKASDAEHVAADATKQFHLHINCYSASLPASVEAMQREGLVTVTQFVRGDAAGDRPLWIATKKAATQREASEWFETLLMRLDADPSMHGYIESEIVRRDYVNKRPAQLPYDASIAFPLSLWPSCTAPRAADIHVFRDSASPYDALDERLAKTGFTSPPIARSGSGRCC